MAAVGYTLEHFYYGQFVRQGKPEGELRLLATSAGIKQDDANEIIRSSLLPPLNGSPVGSWGIVRGKNAPFVFVQSHLTPNGGAMLHVVPIPVDALRGLSGNLRFIARHLLHQQMPEYDRLGDRLLPLVLPDVGPPNDDMQVDAMLALMSATKDRLDVVEWLLSAIVKGIQLYVHNAPPDASKRASFVEGLLALIPPPARFGVTFTLQALPSTKVDAQIFFTTAETTPENVTIYNWADAKVTGNIVTDEYSRFIVSQLRLDTSMVLEQTSSLTPIAAWRIKRGDSLSEALGYAGFRLSMDNAVSNNLPAPVAEVAKVLGEDPTLSDSLRAAYARHILAFALALDDMTHAEPLAAMLHQNPELEGVALRQMQDALHSGKAMLVYNSVKGWISNPLGPKGLEWASLAQDAALGQIGALVKAGDTEGVRQFLDELQRSDQVIEMEHAIPRMIEVAMPMMAKDRGLAERLIILAAIHLPVEEFQKIMCRPDLLSKLPEPVGRLAGFLGGTESGQPPSGLLARAVSSFDEAFAPLLLIRFTEVALHTRHPDLIDSTTLSGLVRAASSDYAVKYDSVFRWVVLTLSTDGTLPTMDESGPRYLLQMLLARHAYQELAMEVVRHLRVLYPSTERQSDFAVMVRRLFAETPLEPNEVASALRSMEAGGVKPLPLAMAHMGALKRGNWSPTLHEIAVSVTALLFTNRTIVEAIPPASLLELLDYHAQRRDTTESIRVAGLLPLVAAQKGEGGAAMMAQMYRTLDWEKQARTAAVEILRRYIRQTDKAFAWQAVARLTEALGSRFGPTLEATYAIRMMMDGEDLSSYAMLLHLTTRLMRDNTLVYVDKRGAPTLKMLVSDLDSLVGGLTDDDRHTLAASMLNLGRAIEQLGKQQRQTRLKDGEGHQVQLIQGKGKPLNGLDVLRVLGGYFTRGKRLQIKFQQAASPHPFVDRAAPSLLLEAQVAVRVLRNLLQAFPPEHTITVTSEALRAEMESLWGDLSLAERRRLVRTLAGDFQQLPEIVGQIYETGDTKALEPTSGLGRKLDANRQRPESTLELYRFVNGYFKMRVRQRSKSEEA